MDIGTIMMNRMLITGGGFIGDLGVAEAAPTLGLSEILHFWWGDMG
jgi:hypothetical protein